MEFLHPDYSSFHDQRAYPLQDTVLKHEIPPQGEFFFEARTIYNPPDYGDYWVSDFFMPFILMLIAAICCFVEAPLALIWWSFYAF